MATDDQIRKLVQETGGHLDPMHYGQLIQLTDAERDLEYAVALRRHQRKQLLLKRQKAIRKALRGCGVKNVEVR
jgi:hypothetical protein